jgi:hypothetical protein
VSAEAVVGELDRAVLGREDRRPVLAEDVLALVVPHDWSRPVPERVPRVHPGRRAGEDERRVDRVIDAIVGPAPGLQPLRGGDELARVVGPRLRVVALLDRADLLLAGGELGALLLLALLVVLLLVLGVALAASLM